MSKQEHIFNNSNCSLFPLVETTATTKFNKTMTTFLVVVLNHRYSITQKMEWNNLAI